MQQAQQQTVERRLPSRTRLYPIEPLPSPGTVDRSTMVQRRHTVAGFGMEGQEEKVRERAELGGNEAKDPARCGKEGLGAMELDFGGDFQVDFDAEMKKWLAPF
jgi:hypothetical protein